MTEHETSGSPERSPGVVLRGIVQVYGSVRALDNADLTAHPGEVHALLGENGAGKSTLAHVLAGEVQPTSGEMRVLGRPARFRSPRDAVRASVGIVHQHFKLVPAFTGLENIALWSMRGLGPLDERAVRERALYVAETVGMELELDQPVRELSVGARQRIEIVKLLYADPRVLVLDEPTAVLAPKEIEELFASLRTLASEGRVVLLIAHKLDEVLSVADRVTVLRRGKTVFEAPRTEVDATSLAHAMVGDDVPGAASVVPAQTGEVVAAATRVTLRRTDGSTAVQTATLEVRRGEIVGIAGVDGNGQRELAQALAGLAEPVEGFLSLPKRCGYISQDRSREGVVGDFSLTENVALGFRRSEAYSSGPFIRWGALEEATARLIEQYDVRVPGPGARARTLSGGNQQKVVVAREIARDPDLMIAENPTRGLDIAATRFVRGELARLKTRERAPGTVLISTDLDEVLELADRVLVLVRGELRIVPEDQRTREGVGALMLSAVAT